MKLSRTQYRIIQSLIGYGIQRNESRWYSPHNGTGGRWLDAWHDVNSEGRMGTMFWYAFLQDANASLDAILAFTVLRIEEVPGENVLNEEQVNLDIDNV